MIIAHLNVAFTNTLDRRKLRSLSSNSQQHEQAQPGRKVRKNVNFFQFLTGAFSNRVTKGITNRGFRFLSQSFYNFLWLFLWKPEGTKNGKLQRDTLSW